MNAMANDSKEQHSKERTKAEAQFKQAQKPQSTAALPTTEAGRAKAEYVHRGSCRTRQDCTFESAAAG